MGEYDGYDEFEDDAPVRRVRILVKDIDDDLKAEYVQMLRDGYDVDVAANRLGSTGTQFKKLRNPDGYWYDPQHAAAVNAALASNERSANQQERVRSMVWAAAEERHEKWAIEKLAYVHLPEFEPLRHTNLRVSTEVYHYWRQVLPHLTEEEILARIEEANRKDAIEGRSVAQLPPSQAA